MRRYIWAAALWTCFGLVACGSDADEEQPVVPLAGKLDSPGNETCFFKCKPCPPGMFCLQVCELVGNCRSNCTVLGLCEPGYHWSEQSCRCQPDGGGVPCGTSRCSQGEYCCNESCGICAAFDEGCIMIACVPLHPN